MKPISRLKGIAAVLPEDNVSTDIISPSELYLKPRSAYGPGLFSPWRYLPDGSENPDFPLNRPPHRGAAILIVGQNFGCGSSREIAVWALQDYGIECVIGPSFGEIFFENALKSGLVAVVLPEAEVAVLAAAVGKARQPIVAVDLVARRITAPAGDEIAFDIDPFRRTVYLEGIEEFDVILREEKAIDAYQARMAAEHPWLLSPGPFSAAEADGIAAP
jgi:3-isopropylmalate/(R)-2-methylmalate dehydratase small subunit